MAQLVAGLYEVDHYVWALAQAGTLRRLHAERTNLPLDFEHLAEEIEGLARAERSAVRSRVRRILEHFLKLEFSPASQPRGGWRGSIIEARARLDDELTPSLKLDIEEQLERLYRRAREQAANALVDNDEAEAAAALPLRCPYTLEQILGEWYPGEGEAGAP